MDLQDLEFSQWYCRRLKSSGMLCCVAGQKERKGRAVRDREREREREREEYKEGDGEQLLDCFSLMS